MGIDDNVDNRSLEAKDIKYDKFRKSKRFKESIYAQRWSNDNSEFRTTQFEEIKRKSQFGSPYIGDKSLKIVE